MWSAWVVDVCLHHSPIVFFGSGIDDELQLVNFRLRCCLELGLFLTCDRELLLPLIDDYLLWNQEQWGRCSSNDADKLLYVNSESLDLYLMLINAFDRIVDDWFSRSPSLGPGSHCFVWDFRSCDYKFQFGEKIIIWSDDPIFLVWYLESLYVYDHYSENRPEQECCPSRFEKKWYLKVVNTARNKLWSLVTLRNVQTTWDIT